MPVPIPPKSPKKDVQLGPSLEDALVLDPHPAHSGRAHSALGRATRRRRPLINYTQYRSAARPGQHPQGQDPGGQVRHGRVQDAECPTTARNVSEVQRSSADGERPGRSRQPAPSERRHRGRGCAALRHGVHPQLPAVAAARSASISSCSGRCRRAARRRSRSASRRRSCSRATRPR